MSLRPSVIDEARMEGYAEVSKLTDALLQHAQAHKAEMDQLRAAINAIVTPALLGLINEGDDDPRAMNDDDAVDITGNGFRCQITVGDIRKAAALANGQEASPKEE